MSFSVGIVGLPNVGKSTLFKALTKKKVDIASYPFTTIEPNEGIVTVPDQRLTKIAEVVKPQKVTETYIKFIDIAGLVKEAHRGEGLGNQFLAQIRECDAILEIVRAFEKEEVAHPEGKIDCLRDIEIIKTELIMKDLETIRKCLGKLQKEAKSGEKVAIKKVNILEKRIEEDLNQGKRIIETSLSEEDSSLIKEFQFLTAKPIVYLINANEREIDNEQDLTSNPPPLFIDLKLEEEASELSPSEIEEIGIKSCLDQLIRYCYNILDLITFYTITGGEETKAWTLKKGTGCRQAAGVVHSDFEQKFIKAEIINWETLVNSGSWAKAKELGLIKTAGKDYLIQDGDVIEFKI